MIESAALQNVLLMAVGVLALLFLLPILVYLCVKMGAVGFFFGRDAFQKSKKNEESPNGNAKGKEETS